MKQRAETKVLNIIDPDIAKTFDVISTTERMTRIYSNTSMRNRIKSFRRVNHSEAVVTLNNETKVLVSSDTATLSYKIIVTPTPYLADHKVPKREVVSYEAESKNNQINGRSALKFHNKFVDDLTTVINVMSSGYMEMRTVKRMKKKEDRKKKQQSSEEPMSHILFRDDI